MMMVKPNGYGWSAAAATGLVDGGYSDRAGRQDWWLAQRAAVSQGQGEVDDATNEVNEGETTAQLALEDLDFTDDISKILAEPKDLAAATSSPKGCGKSRKKGRTSSSSSSGETTAQLALEDLDFTDDISKILAELEDLAAATSSPKGCGKSRKKGRTSSSSSSGWPWAMGTRGYDDG